MSKFIYRGPLAPDSPLFRGRQAELTRLAHLCQGEVQAYAIVYGARQSGKTSLLLRLMKTLPESVKTCYVDLQGLPGATTSQVYNYLAQRLARSLSGVMPGQPCPLPAGAVNDAPGLIDFFCQALSRPGMGRFVLLLEELGALPASTQNDLANVLRSIFSNRFDSACRSLGRLMVVFAGNVELYDLVAKQVSPLYNICEPLYLPDLSEPDAVGLIADGLAQLGVQHANAEALGQAIYAQVSGYPYLTQRLGGFLEENLAAGETLSPAHVNRAVEQILRDDPLLRHLRCALVEQNLLPAARLLLDGRLRFSRLDEEMARLELVGLAAESGGYWQARNRLLECALREWVADLPQPPTASRQAQETSLRQQLAQLEANLLKIQERRTDFIDPRSAPPDWEEAERRIQEEIDRIRTRLAELKAE